MKRLLVLLLVMGMVGCGGDVDNPPAVPSTPNNSQVKVDEPPAQAVGADRSGEPESTSPTAPPDTADDTSTQVTDADPIAGLEERGAEIERNEQGDVIRVNCHSEFTDAGLVYLKGLEKLEILEIRDAPITDAGLAHLKGLKTLKDLRLNGPEITGAGLVHLKDLTKLKFVSLNGAKVTDAGLVHLKEMTNLQRLSVGYLTNVTDAGLVHLKGLTNLERLALTGPKITDAGLVHLKGLTNLKGLSPPRQITDAGFVHIKGLTNLEVILLFGSRITDAGLMHFKGLTKLRMINLSQAFEVTAAGVAELEKALPNCRIIGITK